MSGRRDGPGTPRARSPAGLAGMTVRAGAFELTKKGVARYDFRDIYHTALTVSWPRFALGVLAFDLLINVLFATLYFIRPGCVANARPGSFGDVFFFSVETLATVGYGVMAPDTAYGHVVSAVEIFTGVAFTAIITGVTFVRFSRPRPRILYADRPVVTPHNGVRALMVRIGNGRMTPMIDAQARLSVLLAETTTEGVQFRRTFDLKLVRARIPIFALTWTLIHEIDAGSPIAAYDAARLARDGVRFFLAVEARDPSLAATVHDMKDYGHADIVWGAHYVDAVTTDSHGQVIADLGRISMIETDAAPDDAPEDAAPPDTAPPDTAPDAASAPAEPDAEAMGAARAMTGPA